MDTALDGFRGEVEQARRDIRGRGVPAGVARRLAPRLADARRDARDRRVRPFPWLGAAVPELAEIARLYEMAGQAAAAVVAALGVAAVWDDLVDQLPEQLPDLIPAIPDDSGDRSLDWAGGLS